MTRCFSLFVPGPELKCNRDTDIRGLYKKNPDLFFSPLLVLTVFVGDLFISCLLVLTVFVGGNVEFGRTTVKNVEK
jgi:hypothetical protein